MEFNCRFISERTTQPRRRPTTSRSSALHGRYSLGAAQWCSMEGFTEEVFPLVCHVLAPSAAVDGRGAVAKSMDSLAQQADADGPDRLGRVDRRWDVCSCKKRGECVDLTKPGKGSKVMVLSDGHGLPLAINVASARPHEVTLIEPLLESCSLRR